MAADALDPALGFFGKLPEGSLIIIKDSLAASGCFLLHHYISRLLAAPKAGTQTPMSNHASTAKSTPSDGTSGGARCKVCLVAFDQAFSHFANVGRKQGANLVANAEEGALRFVDGASIPYEWGSAGPRSAPGGVIETSEGLESFLEGGLQELSITGMPQSVRSATGPHSSPQNQPDVSSTGRTQSGSEKQPSRSTAIPPLTFTCHMYPLGASRPQSPILALCQQISAAVSNHSGQPLAGEKQIGRVPPSSGGLAIVFDDLGGPEAACQGSAREVLALLNWCRTLRTPSGERASVVALVHGNESPDGEKGLATIIEHSADLVLLVDPLSTGAAADIHGQLSITQRTNKWMDHLRKETGDLEVSKLPRQQKFQFRLLETGVKLIHIGGSKGGA